MTNFIYIPDGLVTGMDMYFKTTIYINCNYLEMIKAKFLKGHHFLGFDIIKKMENVISGNPGHPPNVKMRL